jgi:hypothetical protein
VNQSIESLRRQLQSQQNQLAETAKAIDHLNQLLLEEQQYTQELAEKQQKPQSQPEAIPKKLTPSKAEKVANMSDGQLLYYMEDKKRREQLFKDL